MTAGQDESADGSPVRGKRRRAKIFDDRVCLSVRLSRQLRDQLMAEMDRLHLPANTWIVGLIEAALADKPKQE